LEETGEAWLAEGETCLELGDLKGQYQDQCPSWSQMKHISCCIRLTRCGGHVRGITVGL